MNVYDFKTKLQVSRTREATDMEVLARIFPNATGIRPGTEVEDRSGADFIVDMDGTLVRVDVKAREKGCSRFWGRDKEGDLIPEIAIELMSVNGRIKGWALDWKKKTDFYLFTFDPDDHKFCYIVAANHIRLIAERYEKVLRQEFKTAIQDSGTWTSECVFLPIKSLDQASSAVYKRRYLRKAS